MTDFKQCEFFLLRYVPDVVKEEFVNVGVVLLEEGDGGFTDVRFTRDWRRVRCLDPEVDVEWLQSYEDELRRLLQSRRMRSSTIAGRCRGANGCWTQMQQSFSGALQLTPMQAVLTESPQVELGKLAHAYLESASRGQRERPGGAPSTARCVTRSSRPACGSSCGRTSRWRSTAPGDPLKIDCGISG